jgi:exodeoxyribonuclease V gamma subunit
VVVAELLDLVDRTFDAGAVRARGLVTVEHRLQPFSPDYFTGGASSRLFSYSRASARALAAMSASGRNGAKPFVTGPLDVASDEAAEIRLDDLIDCWSNPSRFFCTRALGLYLRGEAEPLTECEPMTVNGLDRYKVHDAMLRRHLNGGRTPERERAEAVALGMLPSGALCGVWFDRLDEELSGLLATLGDIRLEDPVHAEVSGSSWTLRGRVEGITGRGRLQVRPAPCKPTDLVRAWITHLALSAAFGATTTEVLATKSHTVFGEVQEPMPLLEALVQGYRAALREPLAFFAQASHAYVEQAIKLETNPRAYMTPLDAALGRLRPRSYEDSPPGDMDDAYVALCWRGRNPLRDAAAEFEQRATAFWRPAMAAARNTTEAGE